MIDPRGWFPTTFLRLLELAVGSEVGVPWIEMRDADGRLARRLHFAFGHPHHLTDGYGAMRKVFHWSGGEYLTAALASPEAREPFFSIALRHCIRAGLPGLTLDDQLDHLVRALECLCGQYGFSRQDLLDGLDSEIKETIGTVLNNARAEISTLASTLPEPGLRSQVSRIAERAQSAAQTDRKFGLAVESLASHFGLLDSEVLGPYYARHPGRGGGDWVGTLSYYRGAVFHEGSWTSIPRDPRGRRVRFHPTPSRPCGSGSSKNSRLQWNVPAPVDSRNGQRKRGLVQARRWCGWPTRSTHAGHQVGYKEASPTAARGDLSGRRAIGSLTRSRLGVRCRPGGPQTPKHFPPHSRQVLETPSIASP